MQQPLHELAQIVHPVAEALVNRRHRLIQPAFVCVNRRSMTREITGFPADFLHSANQRALLLMAKSYRCGGGI
ncbi:MAG: hypothetical protein ACRDBP_18380 [Luteolibacter sp.]